MVEVLEDYLCLGEEVIFLVLGVAAISLTLEVVANLLTEEEVAVNYLVGKVVEEVEGVTFLLAKMEHLVVYLMTNRYSCSSLARELFWH